MFRLQNKSGLVMLFHPNLFLHSIFHKDTFVNLYVGNTLEPSVFNIFLQLETKNTKQIIPLFAINEDTTIQSSETSLQITQKIQNLEIHCLLQLHPKENRWRYQVKVKNQGDISIDYSLIFVQDLGLCAYSAARLNESFVSQYIHHKIIKNPNHGVMILSRQNEFVFGGHPSCFHLANQKMVQYATDGKDIFQNGQLLTLPNRNKQGEHSVIALGSELFTIYPKTNQETNIVSVFFPNLDSLSSFSPNNDSLHSFFLGFPEVNVSGKVSPITTKSYFQNPILWKGKEVSEHTLKKRFPEKWRHVERDEDGNLYSFFTENDSYVTLAKKESLCLRPHGQVTRTGNEDTPKESSLTFTSYFSGIFLSQLTVGHTSLNLLLSRNPMGLGKHLCKGFRIFCKEKETWSLLDTPSYMVFQPKHLVWVYQNENQNLTIAITANDDDSIDFVMQSENENPLDILFSFSIGLDGDNGDLKIPPLIEVESDWILIKPNPNSQLNSRLEGNGFHITSPNLASFVISDDRQIFSDHTPYESSYLIIQTKLQSQISFSISADLEKTSPEKKESFQKNLDITVPPMENIPTSQKKEKTSNHHLSNHSDFEFNILLQDLQNSACDLSNLDFSEMVEILPWYKQNAEIHFLNPRGLEQYSGGGWGTRDVCQGALEFLFSQGKVAAVRNLLLRVFHEQNEDGDWPQWFMLYDRDKEIRANDSHGDIIYWPLLGVFTYLERTEDLSILQERFLTNSKETLTILQAIERSLQEIQKRSIPETSLPKYGHGDWNDSMQPKDVEIREKAVSTWTAELQLILYTKLIWMYQLLGDTQKKEFYEALTKKVKEEIRSHCMPSGVMTGLVKFKENGEPSYLLHPLDGKTNIHYSILPMIYGILSNVFTLEEANHHLEIIQDHLTGPDGARLFDKPVSYQDGKEKFFRRAETASFFGREIGLMYTHAHLRYCEALAHMGKADVFFKELNRTNPIGITNRIPTAKLRQSNCYYSSSDANFLNRYEAQNFYEGIQNGTIPLEGGWRVYSSGPGIFWKLFLEQLLGIQIQSKGLLLDPMLPKSFDGLSIHTNIFGMNTIINYRVLGENGIIQNIFWNESEIPKIRVPNVYRAGGFQIQRNDLEKVQKKSENRMEVLIK